MSPRILARALVTAAAGLLCAGCLNGAIFEHYTVPLDLDLDATPVHQRDEDGSRNTLRIYYFQVDWGSDGLGDVAKRHGMTRIYYADLEVLSVLGIWTQRWAHVYGE